MKKITFTLTAVFLSFYIFTLIPFKISASYTNSTDNISYEKVNPNKKNRYKIKRFGEKINLLRFKMFNKEKLPKYRLNLVNKRAREIIYLANNRELDYLENAVSRYTTEVGLFSEEIGDNSPRDYLENSSLINYEKGFENARDLFPSQTSQWLLLQQAADVYKTHFSGLY